MTLDSTRNKLGILSMDVMTEKKRLTMRLLEENKKNLHASTSSGVNISISLQIVLQVVRYSPRRHVDRIKFVL